MRVAQILKRTKKGAWVRPKKGGKKYWRKNKK